MHVQIRYVPVSAGPAELQRDTADGLKALIEVALEISNLKEFLGREKPTVITVRAGMFLYFSLSANRCYPSNETRPAIR
jgi:hypothetical protein